MNYFVLVRPFLALALLRGSPQNLPASGLLLGVSAFAYLIMRYANALTPSSRPDAGKF